jgi:hydroxylamine dehydrogenase
MILLICGVLFTAMAHATFSSVPSQLYEALGIEKTATPKELHEAVTKRYNDPAQGAGKGKHAQYWEPIPMSMYFDPKTFYEAPSSPDEIAGRADCVECHTDETPVWVAAWKKSTHANLSKIRKLKPEDPRFYKKAKLEEIENNLRSMGKLGETEKLKEVGCIDCHVAINTTKDADHKADMRMPTAEECGTCHLQEFADELKMWRLTLIKYFLKLWLYFSFFYYITWVLLNCCPNKPNINILIVLVTICHC